MVKEIFFSFLLVSCSILFPINSFAQESRCPYKVLDSGNLEGIYAGIDGDDFCSAIFIMGNGEEVMMLCGHEEPDELFGDIGNRVYVEYELTQFWNELGEFCSREEIVKSGRILEVGAGLEVIKKNAGVQARLKLQEQDKKEEESRQQTQMASNNIPKVTAPVLAGDYANNELAADKKYRGKGGIVIGGVVYSIQKTFGQIQLIFEGQKNAQFNVILDYVYINLDESQEDMAIELRKGQQVAVKCKDVENTLSVTSASGCVFVNW